MEELNEYDFEVHIKDQPFREIKRIAKTQLDALAAAEQDYANEPGYLAVISIDPHKL